MCYCFFKRRQLETIFAGLICFHLVFLLVLLLYTFWCSFVSAFLMLIFSSCSRIQEYKLGGGEVKIWSILEGKVKIKLREKSKTFGTTNFSALLGVFILCISLSFVWEWTKDDSQSLNLKENLDGDK